MERTDFERQINTLIPRPDPETTADLFAFGQELGDTAECFGVQALLTSLQFIARNFDEQTLQSAYEIIQHGFAALPGEMVAAAVYLQNGCTPQHAAEMAEAGMLMCFDQPDSANEPSPLAVCTVIENGILREFHTLYFGGFDPETALRAAQEYAQIHRSSVTGALMFLTTDMEIKLGGGYKKILVSGEPDMTKALSAIFRRCPAVAAHMTFDVGRGQAEVEYNPLWLELRQKQEPERGGMQLTV